MEEKTAKTSNLFKSFTEYGWRKILFRSAKLTSHPKFGQFCFQVKMPHEHIIFQVKKQYQLLIKLVPNASKIYMNEKDYSTEKQITRQRLVHYLLAKTVHRILIRSTTQLSIPLLFDTILSWSLSVHRFNLPMQTYPAGYRKIAAVNSHNQDGIERRDKTNEKKDFCTQSFKVRTILMSFRNLNELLFRSETTQGPLSIPISIRDGN